jgi:tetratricopeptide (TPR) repeat protein
MEEISIRDLSQTQRTLYKTGEDAIAKKNYTYAADMYRRIVKQAPGCLEVRHKLHESYTHLKKAGAMTKIKVNTLLSVSGLKISGLIKDGKIGEALDLGEELMSMDPSSSGSAKLIASVARDTDHHLIGISALKTSLKFNPENISTLEMLAELYEEIEDYGNSLPYWKKLKEIQPANPKYDKKFREVGTMETMRRGKWDEVEQGKGDYRTVMKDQDSANLLEQQGHSHATADGRKLLLDNQLKELEANDSVINRRKLAELYAEDENFVESLEWYKKTNELSGVEDPAILKSMIIVESRNYDSILQQWVDYSKSGIGEDEKANAEQSIAQCRQQKLDMLIERHAHRVEIQPNNHEGRYDYASALYEAERWDDALPNFQKIQDNPRFKVNSKVSIGNCFQAKKVYDLAIDNYKNVIESMPGFDNHKKEVVYQLGRCYVAQKNLDEAMNCFREIYQVDVSFRDVSKIMESGLDHIVEEFESD